MNNHFTKANINLSEEQLNILHHEGSKIVHGRAGTGKTLLAILYALRKNNEYQVEIIVYTKALCKFIRNTLDKFQADNTVLVNYIDNSKRTSIISDKSEILIIDEYQDFSLSDLIRLKENKKEILVFGDFFQQLYETNFRNEKNITLEEIKSFAKTNEFEEFRLTKSFRVPNSIASVVNQINRSVFYSDKFELETHLHADNEKPLFLKFNQHSDEKEWIANFLKNNTDYNNTGILFAANDGHTYRNDLNNIINDLNIEQVDPIPSFVRDMYGMGINMGFKYRNQNNLSFENNVNINAMTIHSSKGIEFDCVILPFCKFQNSIGGRLLYVAQTRCSKKLIVTFSGTISQSYHVIDEVKEGKDNEFLHILKKIKS